MRVVLDSKIPYIKGVLEPYFDVEYLEGEEISPSNLIDCDAMVVRTRTKCSKELLSGSKVKFIATATIGFDHIDMDYCKANSIEVATAAGCNKSAVLQYILTVLSTLKVTPKQTTVGVIGYGNIGSLLVEVLSGLGFSTMFYDPFKALDRGVSLENLLQNSDVVTMHTPLTSECDYPTLNLANSNFFEKIKTGAIFINSSRGEVVDENALLSAIDSGKVSAAVIDVWRNEPHINQLLLQKATLATTHIAGYSRHGKERATEMAVRALGDKFDIKKLKSWSVNSKKSETVEPTWENIQKVSTQYFDIKKESQTLKQNPQLFEKIRKDYHFREEFLEVKE
ncbi:MAG: 4-phosphoerythronate dehydrogenase [Rikenellaceae bacterium]